MMAGVVVTRERVNPVSTVLVADDDPHIREVVAFALRKQGFDTLQASNGKEVLAMFDEHRPDLVVLDILMPELDGTQVCREIRKRADTPIVFLTSKDDAIDRIIGLELGGDDYISKPFSPRELVARVRAVLRRAIPAAGAAPQAAASNKPAPPKSLFKISEATAQYLQVASCPTSFRLAAHSFSTTGGFSQTMRRFARQPTSSGGRQNDPCPSV